ncbi:MAG: ferredoxin [Acidimicrobiales bacterium]
MRVRVDPDLCQGHGVCESEAPAVFSLQRKGGPVTVLVAPAEDQRAVVAAAVRFCPTMALTIEED